MEPFGWFVALDRQGGGEDHGPQRLAILFIGGDGIASYDALYCQRDGTPPAFLAVIQDHGFGGNYNRFGQDGLLETVLEPGEEAAIVGRLRHAAGPSQSGLGGSVSTTDELCFGHESNIGHESSIWDRGKMVAESRQELFECQTAEQYEQIGRFVVEFEQACSWLRIGIIFSLHHDGLRTQRLAQILIDNTVMTAAPLIKAYDAIMTEIGVREDPVQKEVLDQVSKEFHALTSERNKVVHGLWFIGYASVDDQDFSKISGIKGNPSKKQGMNFQHLPKRVEEIAKLVERTKNLNELLIDIHALLTLQASEQGKVKFENSLTKEGDTWTSKRPERIRKDAETSGD